MILSNAALIALCDDIASGYLAEATAFATAFGLLDTFYGVTLPAEANTDATLALGKQIAALRDAQNVDVNLGTQFIPLLAALDRHARLLGAPNFSTFDTWLTYRNVGSNGAGGPWKTILHPSFRALFNQAKGLQNFPSPCNLYFHVDHVTDANALSKIVFAAGVPARTDGVAIDGTKYAGGDPKVYCAALAGGEGGNVTVTATVFDPNTNTVLVGKTFTALINATGLTVLAPGGGTPAPANSKILDVTGFASAAGGGLAWAAATIYIEGHKPAGRP